MWYKLVVNGGGAGGSSRSSASARRERANSAKGKNKYAGMTRGEIARAKAKERAAKRRR